MLKYSLLTNIGSRDINEDSIGAYEKDGNYCFILCDGLGGHGMGDAASICVRNVFKEDFEKNALSADFLKKTFERGQKVLLEEQERLHAGYKMKTTAVAFMSYGRKAYIGHVGDSRLYIFKNNMVNTRTLDHSVPQMLVLSKQLKECEIRNHPDRSILLRVMGVEWEQPMYELMSPIPLRKCQAVLLCSDGFWELIEENEMCELLKKAESPEQWLKEMEAVVRANGMGKNMDNYSAIAVWNMK